MSDIDLGLKAILERAVPPAHGDGADWEDVLRRAERGGEGTVVQPNSRRSRRGWYALAAAALVTALVVNPAFGVGERIVDWFTGSPAPEHVREELAAMDAPEGVRALFAGPEVRAEEARGVMAIETSRGPAYLWAAPTESGGWCTYVQYPETESGGSSGTSCDMGPPDDDPLVAGAGTDATGGERFTLLEGRVQPPVESLVIHFADGSTEPVPFAEGFFLYEVPSGREPTVLIARDGRGKVVAREATMLAPPVPPGDLEEGGGQAFDRKVIEIETSTGATVRLFSAEDSFDAGDVCYAFEVTGGYAGDLCTTLDRAVTVEADDVQGQKEPLILLHGAVAPRVASLQLRFEDGETIPVRVVERFFLLEVPLTRQAPGRLPAFFIARDRGGRVVGRVPARTRL